MRGLTPKMSAAVIALAAGAAGAAGSAPALADEVWSTPFGDMQWETTLRDMAVFNLYGDGVAPSEMRVFLPGLQNDVMGGRGHYSGFWTAESGQPLCSAALTDPMGTTTYDWGRVELTFERGEFPSGWTARFGTCFGEPEESFRGVTPAGGGK